MLVVRLSRGPAARVTATWSRLCPCLLLLAPGLLAQQPVSLQQTLEFVLAHNPAVQAAEAQVRAARGGLTVAGALPSPVLSYSLSKVTDRGGISEQVPLPGTLSLRRQVAQAQVEQALEALQLARVDLAYQARTAFFAVLLAQRQLQAARQSLRAAQHIEQAASKRFQAGDVAGLEVMQANVRSAIAQRSVSVAQGQLHVAGLKLNLLLGRAATAPLQLNGKLSQLPTPAPLSLADLLSTTLPRQPQWRAAQALVRERRRELALARRAAIPRFALGASYGTEDGERTPGFNAAVTIPMPGAVHGAIAQAQAAELGAQAQRQSLCISLAQALAAAFEQWKTAQSQVALYQAGLLKQAQQQLTAA